VALRAGPRVAGDALFTCAGDGLSLLCGEAGDPGPDRPGDAAPDHCGPVAPDEKRRADAAGRGAGQHEKGLVAVRAGA